MAKNDKAKPVICSGGFIVKNNKFLFGKRSKKKDWAAGLWDIVGGRSLKNEHPLITLQRETKEETGVNVLNAELLLTTHIPGDRNKDLPFTYHIYMITHFKGKPSNNSNEHTKLKWFTREELNNLPLALPQYLQLIDHWIENR